MVDRVDRKVHRNDAVASAESEQRVGVGARGCQQAVAEGVGAFLADILIIRTAVGVVLLYAGKLKLLLERETRDVGGTDAHRVVEHPGAAVAGVGEELVALDVEEPIVVVAAAADQLVDEGQGDVVVDRREAADQRAYLGILHERRSRKHDVHRGCVVVNHRVGLRLDDLLVAHMVGGAGDKTVDIAVGHRVAGCVGRVVITYGSVHPVVDRHHQLHIVHAAARRVVGGGEGEVTHHRVGSDGMSRKVGRGRHRVEGVLPHIGGDGGVLVEDDGSLRRHRVARSLIVLRQDGESHIALAVVQAVVHQQETHLGARRLKARGGVHTLEIPEDLIVGHVDTRGHIHPHTQRVGHVQPFGVSCGIVRHGEGEAAESEVAQADAGDILLWGDGISHLHARRGGGGKVGVVLEEDGVRHTVGGAHIVVVAIAVGAIQLVGVVGAVYLLERDSHLGAAHIAVGVGDGDTVGAATRRTHPIRPPRVAVGRGAARRAGRKGSGGIHIAWRIVSGDRDVSLDTASILLFHNHHILKDRLVASRRFHHNAVGTRLQSGNLIA